MIRARKICILVSAAIAFCPVLANACGFHRVEPRSSVVSALVESKAVVLAIADPDDPFRYRPIDTIRGDDGGVAIPFLIDSSTRRKLALNTSDRVLFALEETTGQWSKLSYIDDARAEVFDEIFKNLNHWENYNADRFGYFASLLVHDDMWVRTLALSELDQAPYAVLQSLDVQPDTAKLIADIAHPNAYGLEAISVLLLGLSGDEEARRYLYQNLKRALARPQDKIIGAYVTAILEWDGVRGLAALDRAISTDARLSEKSRDAIALALVMQRLHGPSETRRITARYARDLIQRDAGFEAAFSRTLKPVLAKSQASTRRGINAKSSIPTPKAGRYQ